MRLLLALVASTAFVPITLEDGATCEAPGALACVPLAATDGAVRVQAEGARYVIEDADGALLAAGPVAGDRLVPLPEGAARLVVYSA